MTKFLKPFTFLSLACLSFSSFAKTVSENTAKTVGTNFLISKGITGVRNSSDLTMVYAATDKSGSIVINDYYVFNINGYNGFVMVSGDDLVQPILAYSNEASFDINNISPDAKWWIEGYKNQITYVVEHNLPANEGWAEQWADLKLTSANIGRGAKTTAVAPLLATTWDQSPYYNYLCPGSGTTKSYTGCVATAMAQVMKYWNWPTVGTGAHTYTPSTNGGLYGSQTADFGNTVYNWSGMPNSISSNNTNIARLMYHAGIATNMDYGYTAAGSGTYVIYSWSPILNCAEYALPTYFRYKNTLKGLSRSATPGGLPAIPQATWISYLTTELDAQRPVIYSGSEASGGGHCWVADGYDASKNMHFNWGWGGTGPNGYYSVNSIAPPALGAGGGSGNFNSNQCIIIGIQPDTAGTPPSGNIKMLTHLDCPTNSPINYDGSFNVTAKILNSATTTFKGDFCVQVFDASNSLSGTVQTITGQTVTAGDSTGVLTFSTTGLLQMIPGKYTIKLMYRPTGSATWTAVANNGTFLNYNSIDVINSQIVELYDSMHVGSHTIRRHSVLTMNTAVADFGNYDFYGSVKAILVNVATGTQYPVQQYTGESIAAGFYKTYTFTSSPITAPAGTYILAVQHEPNSATSYTYTGSDVYENPIIINIIAGLDAPVVSAASDNISVYPNPAKDFLNVEFNGKAVSEVRVLDIEGRQFKTITVAPGQAGINLPVAELSAGMYLVEMQAGEEIITKKIVVTK